MRRRSFFFLFRFISFDEIAAEPRPFLFYLLGGIPMIRRLFSGAPLSCGRFSDCVTFSTETLTNESEEWATRIVFHATRPCVCVSLRIGRFERRAALNKRFPIYFCASLPETGTDVRQVHTFSWPFLEAPSRFSPAETTTTRARVNTLRGT